MSEMKAVYIVISQTPTKFAGCIRKLGKTTYNHAAISFDKDLKEIYAFARPNYHAVLLGKLVRESYSSYTLNKDKKVPVMIFKLEVSADEYYRMRNVIQRIKNDPEYVYNLFSVLTYPVIRGFRVRKTFTCIEFIMHIIKHLGYPLTKPCHKYKPDELVTLLSDNLVYKGDIRKVMDKRNVDHRFFDHLSFDMKVKSVCQLYMLCKRSVGF